MGKHSKNEANKTIACQKAVKRAFTNIKVNATKICLQFCQRLSKFFEKVVYPQGFVCIDCGKEIGVESDRFYSLCPQCAAKLPYRTEKYCEKCGVAILEGRLCKRCQIADYGFTTVISPFNYDGVIKNIIISYKESGKTYLYLYIARHLAAYFMAMQIKVDCVAFVPSQKIRIASRGFDHIKKVAKEFSNITGITMIDALDKVKHTSDQTKNNRQERFSNMEGAFAIKKGTDLKNKSVVIIDDIVTTGATVSECSKQLLGAGAASVIVLSFARR